MYCMKLPSDFVFRRRSHFQGVFMCIQIFQNLKRSKIPAFQIGTLNLPLFRPFKREGEVGVACSNLSLREGVAALAACQLTTQYCLITEGDRELTAVP